MIWASEKLFQELEEVPMTMTGGLDVHRQQLTFDYVDDDGLVHWGQVRPATRKTLRGWLVEHCPGGDAEFALEGCTGWRYVVEELRAAGVGAHLGDPAEIAGLRGPKKRAKTDRADARLLRNLLLQGRFPESWIPPAHVLEMRTLGRLYCTLMDERRAWQQRIHAQLFHQGCPPIRALLSAASRDALARAELSAAGCQYVDTALRRIDELSAESEPLRAQLTSFARRQRGCQALRARHYGPSVYSRRLRRFAITGPASRPSRDRLPTNRLRDRIRSTPLSPQRLSQSPLPRLRGGPDIPLRAYPRSRGRVTACQPTCA
jgi:transposase